MKPSVKNCIYQAIMENKWLDLEYCNAKKEITRFYYGVTDIDLKKQLLRGDIFNPFKDKEHLDCLKNPMPIRIESIKSASLVDQSCYLVSQELKQKISSAEYFKYLEVDQMDNNILRYLSDCYRFDNDPFIRDSTVLDDIDFNKLKNNKKIQLDMQQFKQLIDALFQTNFNKAEQQSRFCELALNVMSIDINNRFYVVAYRHLTLNFKDKTLMMAEKSTINKSFLIDKKKCTLGMYLDISPDEFASTFDEKEEEYKALLESNFRNHEIINTKAAIFLIRRETQKGVEEAFESIDNMDKEGKLTHPLKAFFGRNKSRGTNQQLDIVVFNKDKINVDQIRVVYNAMANHTTYIKGPPGTGKTETIFNVLLSAYYNNKKVLVCSNNNHPVDDIFRKMVGSISHKNYQSQKDELVYFPIIRLGNNEEMISTLEYLKRYLEFARENKNTVANEASTEKSKTKSLEGFEQLKQLIEKYELKKEIEEKIVKLRQILLYFSTDTNTAKKVQQQIDVQTNKFDEIGEINDEEIKKYAISASSSRQFQNYMYYSSLLRLKKLNSPTYKDLREIIEMDACKETAILFNKYLKDDNNLRRLLDIFPIVVCTNLSSEKLGSPKPHFDLCIMDEAGQCNVASSLIPIVRANDLLLVGDTNQLQPVTVIELDLNDALKEKYNIHSEYDYVSNSILSTMLAKDNNSKCILLSYHYRCGKKIAGFVNKRFYDNQLKLKNENEGILKYYDVKNIPIPGERNAYFQEAECIANIMKDYNYKDVAIITPFVNQAHLINQYLRDKGVDESVKAGTIHTLQGSEKPVIILSSAISLKTGKKTMDWIKNNQQLINVGVTRAQEAFIFVGDKKAIDTLSGDEVNDLKALSDYVSSKGEYEVPKSKKTIVSDFSNGSESEKQFFETISPYFKRKAKFKIERNVKVTDAIPKVRPEHLPLFGNKEFDVVVKSSDSRFGLRYTTRVVFEVDGGEHVGDSMQRKRDAEKAEICKLYGIHLIRIPNNKVKDYQLIISLFESVTKNVDMDEAYEQGSLFED